MTSCKNDGIMAVVTGIWLPHKNYNSIDIINRTAEVNLLGYNLDNLEFVTVFLKLDPSDSFRFNHSLAVMLDLKSNNVIEISPSCPLFHCNFFHFQWLLNCQMMEN